MAKKKVAHSHQQQEDSKHEEAPHQEEKPDRVTESEPMAHKPEPAEKLQNLKSLNNLLLKETFERRQQVESLEQAKGALEAELSRFEDQNRGLETELSRANRQNVALELEKAVVCVFLETQLSQMFARVAELKGEMDAVVLGFEDKVGELADTLENERAALGEVIEERDSLKSDYGRLMAKASTMRGNLDEMEKVRRNLGERFEKLTLSHNKLIEEKNEGDSALKAVIRERDSVRGNLVAATKEIDGLMRRIDELVRENKGLKVEKCGQEEKITELKKEMEILDGIVESLREEGKKLQDQVLELSERCDEAREKEKDMVREIEAVVKVRKEKEASIKMLEVEKDSFQKLLKVAQKEVEDKEQLMEGIVRKKIEIEEANYHKQNEIAGLHKEVGELKDEISALQRSCRDETEKSKALVSELTLQRVALADVSLERDSIQKDLDKEKQNVMSLRLKIAELENRIEETAGDLTKVRDQREKLIVQKEEVEKRCTNLINEKELADQKLQDTERRVEDLKAKMESAEKKSERALTFLKRSAAFCNQAKESIDGKEEGFVDEAKDEEDIQSYTMHLESIKKAFEMKEFVVEDLKQQVEFLQDSMAKAQKSKGLWTLLSSATTLFAAVSVAYLARVR